MSRIFPPPRTRAMYISMLIGIQVSSIPPSDIKLFDIHGLITSLISTRWVA